MGATPTPFKSTGDMAAAGSAEPSKEPMFTPCPTEPQMRTEPPGAAWSRLEAMAPAAGLGLGFAVGVWVGMGSTEAS